MEISASSGTFKIVDRCYEHITQTKRALVSVEQVFIFQVPYSRWTEFHTACNNRELFTITDETNSNPKKYQAVFEKAQGNQIELNATLRMIDLYPD